MLDLLLFCASINKFLLAWNLKKAQMRILSYASGPIHPSKRHLLESAPC